MLTSRSSRLALSVFYIGLEESSDVFYIGLEESSDVFYIVGQAHIIMFLGKSMMCMGHTIISQSFDRPQMMRLRAPTMMTVITATCVQYLRTM